MSVVSPVYRGAGTVGELHRRLCVVAESMAETEFEFIYVEDASGDPMSWAALVELAAVDTRVTAVRLVENVRQTRAIFAGTELASGEAIVVMDSDLEDPPEAVPLLLDHYRKGHDLVVAARQRQRTSFSRQVGSRVLNGVAYSLGLPITDIGSSFLVMGHHVEAGVRAELARTGIQLVLPTNYAVSRNPTSLAVRSADPRPSDYASPELLRIGADFLSVYATGPIAVRLAVLGSGVALRALHRSRTVGRAGCGVGAAAVLLGVAAALKWESVRPRRDPDVPLYQVAEVVGRAAASHGRATRSAVQ